ncbi:Integrin beta-PS, partial [Fragariocoptes setiger]
MTPSYTATRYLLYRSSMATQRTNYALHTLVWIVLLNTLLSTIYTNHNHLVNAEECVTRQTCGECITAGPECAWCMQDNYSSDGSRHRCDTVYNLQKSGCHESQIFHPGQTFMKVVDLELSNRTQNEEDAVQLKPQRVFLRLKPHSPRTINVQFKQVLDYPVDLYYLMDLSKSMADDKAKLAELGNQLAANMQRITSNFRLGFGSFVDKVAMPYVSTVPEKLRHPCPECAAPYGFRNHMPLNTDTSGFTREVSACQISGNLDSPEGGLDAIMQCIVCPKEIGWRSKSRKMLVFTTDASFHSAGDGKLAGIVSPNDGMCHLDGTGLYTESTEQDYPSVSQVNQKAQEHHVNIIFATTNDQYPMYKALTPLIEASSAGRLDNDSSNIVQLVEQQYNAMTSSVELKDNATSYVQLTYHSTCVNERRRETNICNGLKVGTTVSFDIDIEVKSCPRNPREQNQTIQIYPVGLSESLIIDLEMICECDCEKPWNIEEHSPRCSGHGTYSCGICICDPNRYGRECECDSKDSDPAKDLLGCFHGNDTRVCSGRGVCRCGLCDCQQKGTDLDSRVYGKYCECDNFSCDRHEGKVCSGPEHGTCECGVCKCNKDWAGSACECFNSTESCIDPKSGKICAGHGECICGQCKCLQTEDRQYTGKYCEECPTCPTLCEQFKDCVRCDVFNTGPLTKEECALCKNSTFFIDKVNKLEVEEGETLCVFVDDDDCKYQFKYKQYRDETTEFTHVFALEEKDCPTPIPILWIMLLLALLILLLGLIGLLLWKLLTMIKDKREIAKFEKERLTMKWDTGENPIFKQATSTFKNPIYHDEKKKQVAYSPAGRSFKD